MDQQADNGVRLPWSRSDRRVPRLIMRPVQSFLETEAAGGILLLAATVMALVWANLPDAHYDRFWGRTLSIDTGGWSVHVSLREFIGEGLMTLFFFVVGLEVKRELTTGELRERKVAQLPIAAAIGGMILPALIYLSLNAGKPGQEGWGIPMATDLAFAVALVMAFGKGLPPGLRMFVLALAVVDDVGTVLVVALFYGGGIHAAALAMAAALVGLMAMLYRGHVRWMPAYVLLGIGVWLATAGSGLQPTIAGAVLGLLTPSRPFQRPAAVSEEAHRTADQTVDDPWPPDADAHHWLRLAWLSREAVSPLARLERALHPWVSYLIVPLFALANVGVSLAGGTLGSAARSPVTWGIVAARLLGKPLGIMAGAFLAMRLGVAILPSGLRWRHILAAGSTAGVGLVVSLFVADLAFDPGALLNSARVGILVGSACAALVGALLLFRARATVAEGPAGS